MAGKMTLQEKLAAARAGGPPKPVAGQGPTPEEVVSSPPTTDAPERTEPAAPAPGTPPAEVSEPPARKLTLQEKLAAARAGGTTDPPSREPAEPAPPRAAEPAEPAAEASASPDAPAPKAMTLQEKLAAARGGAATAGTSEKPRPSAAPTPPAPTPADANPKRPLSVKEKLAAARGHAPETAAEPAPPAQPAPPQSPAPGRPLSVKEKLAAARGSGASEAPATAGAPGPSATAAPAPPRVLPPLAEMTDSLDLAEALRREAAARESRRADAPTVPERSEAARGPLVLPYDGQAASAEEAGSTGTALRPALAVLAGVVLAWLILVGGLAGIGFVLLKVLASGAPA